VSRGANILQSLFLGIAVAFAEDGTLEVGFATHDGTYSNDFAVWQVTGQDSVANTPESRADELTKHLVGEIEKYREKHLCKFLGAGLTKQLVELAPQLPSQLWLELDIVPFVFRKDSTPHFTMRKGPSFMTVDEVADSMARTCLQ
jgi:hypothetical protein